MTDKVARKKKVNYKEIFDAFPESIIIIDKNIMKNVIEFEIVKPQS